MTNLKNHLRSYHCPEYRNLYDDDLAEVQSQPEIDVFCKPIHTMEKLSPVSVRAQELTSSIVDFVIHNFRTCLSMEEHGEISLRHQLARPLHGSILDT